MKTAVVYARYSSDSQTEQSIEGQLHVCEEFAKANDILILDSYIDRAMTGTNDNRPDFQKMLKDSNKKEWDYVLVYKLDRFSRNKYESVMHKRTLKENGVKVLSAMENIPDTPEGIILESLLEGMNQYYSAELSQKIKRGMNESRNKGNFTGGKLIYGYKIENQKVIIDEEQAEVIRYIYKEYALGTYVKDIIEELTNRHIYNKNKPFARSTIYDILKNEKYAGIYRFKGQVFDNMYPRIISHDLYESVRKKVNLNKYGKRSVENTYLFRNKIKCGYCGSNINAESGTARDGTRRHYYKCLGRKLHFGCNKKIVRKDLIESTIIDSIIKELKNEELINMIVKNVIDIQEQIIKENLTLTNLIKGKKKQESILNNIMIAIEQGIINKTTKQRMQDVEKLIDELEQKILIEKNKENPKVTESEIRQFYERALNLEAKLLINYLVKEIELFDDEIKITFNTPIKTSPDECQGFYYCIKRFIKEIENETYEISIYI